MEIRSALLLTFACSDSPSSDSDGNTGGVSSSPVVDELSSSSVTSSSSVMQSSSSLVIQSSSSDTFIDVRDGQVYEYVTIGDQVWK